MCPYLLIEFRLMEVFVGVELHPIVRDLFKQAKKKLPVSSLASEIDAQWDVPVARTTQWGNDERENALNQFADEMDGFGSNSGVIMLLPTDVNVLDKALLRAGRFDRQIHVDLLT